MLNSVSCLCEIFIAQTILTSFATFMLVFQDIVCNFVLPFHMSLCYLICLITKYYIITNYIVIRFLILYCVLFYDLLHVVCIIVYSQNQDDENKRHGCIIDFSNHDIFRIIKTLPRYVTSPDVSDPNSRNPSSVINQYEIEIYRKVNEKQNEHGRLRESQLEAESMNQNNGKGRR